MQAAGKRFIWHGSRSDIFRLWNLSDLHMMAKACAEGKLRRDRDEIRDDPFSIWHGGGDYCDFIGKGDKRFDADAVADWVKVSDLGRLGTVGYRAVRDLLFPIAGKCMGLIEGNHERHYALANEQASLHDWLCTELEAPNLGYSAIYDLVFCLTTGVRAPRVMQGPPSKSYRRQEFRIFVHHGSGFATTKGGKINRLQNFINDFEADVYFMGHVHDQMGTTGTRIGADKDCTKLVEITKPAVISGSYLKTYAEGVTTYGEQRGYKPTTLGAAFVTIKPDSRELHCNS